MLKLVFFVIIISLIPFAFAQNDNTCNGLTDENPVIITTDKPKYTYEDSEVIVSICMSADVYHKHIRMTVFDLHGNEMFDMYDPGFPNLSLDEDTRHFVQKVPLDSFEKWQKYSIGIHASGEAYHTYFGYNADMFQEYFSEKYNYYIYPTTFWRLSPHTTDDVARFDAEAPSTIDTFAPYFEITKLEVNPRHIKFGNEVSIGKMHTELFEELIQETIGRQLDFEKDIIITDTFATESEFLHNIQVTMIVNDDAREIHSTMLQTDAGEIFIFILYGSRAEVYDDRVQEFIDSVNTLSTQNERDEEFMEWSERKDAPEWVKNVIVWYDAGKISDIEFIDSLQYMISKNIIDIELYLPQGIPKEFSPKSVKTLLMLYAEGTGERYLTMTLSNLMIDGIIQPTKDYIVDAELSVPFELYIDQTAHIDAEDISITFVEVLDDSRCPEDEDVYCDWAGDGIIRIEILDSDNVSEMILHTNTYNRGSDNYHFNEYEILLDDLLPHTTFSGFKMHPYSVVISVHETVN
jgi:hypothetical protein